MSHNGFAKFATIEARDRFADEVVRADPALNRQAFVPRNRADIVFEQVSPEQLTTLQEALSGRGRWFEDVQFRTF